MASANNMHETARDGILSAAQGIEFVRCAFCEADDVERLGHFSFAKRRLTVVRCKRCGLIYVNPRFSSQMMNEYFQHYRDIRPDIVEYYRRNIQPKLAHDLQRLQEIAPQNRGRLLDVGCCYGFFLDGARALGWTPTGVEIAEQNCVYARQRLNLDVFNGYLQDAHFPDETFDVVTAFDMLYYSLQPMDDLREMYRVLRPGGVFYIRITHRAPYLVAQSHLAAWLGRVANFDNSPFIVDDHLFHFSLPVLKAMMTRVGFERISVYNAEYSYWPGLSLANRAARCLSMGLFRAAWALSGGRWVLSPAIAAVAYKPGQIKGEWNG